MLNILGYKADDYKKLVTQELVKKLYINMEQVPKSDPPKFNLEWGVRAFVEFSKMEILTFASKVKFNVIVTWNFADLYLFIVFRFTDNLLINLEMCGLKLKKIRMKMAPAKVPATSSKHV